MAAEADEFESQHDAFAIALSKAFHEAGPHYLPWPDSLSPCPDWIRHLATFEAVVESPHLDAARSAPPITATALRRTMIAVLDTTTRRRVLPYVDKIIAALPVREEGPTGIDASVLEQAMRNVHAPAGLLTDFDAVARQYIAEYDRLTREASHVR